MKKLLSVLFFILLTACSLDNKTGIWQSASEIETNNQTSKSISNNNESIRYEDVFIKNQVFNEEKEIENLFSFKIDRSIKIVNWLEKYAIPTNNISNFSYNGKKLLLSKSKKLHNLSTVKENVNKNVVFYEGNLISYDQKGSIFIYSTRLKKKIFTYNFYKKKFKKFNKKINFIIRENTLYAADNLGYIYALNISNKSIIWAKNYGIPFRSNLKFANNQIFLANQDNVVYSIDAKTGNKNWEFATSLTFLKSNYENTFALDLKSSNLFFLNTSGELYSINMLTQKINWVLNFKNQSLASVDTELFFSKPIVIRNNIIIISTEKNVLGYDLLSASRLWNFSVQSIFKPLINSNYTYLITKSNLLICLDNLSGNVLWSVNIFKNIDNKKLKKKFGSIIDFKIVNSEINLYSTYGYLLSFNPENGNLNSYEKISKSGISSYVFFLNNNMLFMDNKNKLLKYN